MKRDVLPRDLFEHKLLDKAAAAWGGTLTAYLNLDVSDARLFEINTPSGPMMLRVTGEGRFAQEDIECEMQWIAHLKRAGLLTLTPTPAHSGELVLPFILELEEGELKHFFAVAYPKIPEVPFNPSIWTRAKRDWEMGRIQAQLHQASQSFQRENQGRRNSYLQLHNFSQDFVEPHRGSQYDYAVKKFDVLRNTLASLPESPGHFGLVHNDIHDGNLVVSGDTFALIDFEDCQFRWYAADLGNALFHQGEWLVGKERQLRIREFLRNFVAGYTSIAALPEAWLSWIPTFVELRRMILFFESLALPGQAPWWANDPEWAAIVQAWEKEIAADEAFLEKGTF